METHQPAPDSWTPRQRQVLDLLAQRRSNAEIAAELGISVDGVKWHVREILSTLGVPTREDAAEYWREANGVPARLRRLLMPPVAGLGVAKVAGGVLAVTAVALVAVMAVVRTDVDPNNPNARADAGQTPAAGRDIGPFYLEASIKTANASVDEPYDAHPPSVSELRWWWANPKDWRYEQTSHERDGRMVSALQVADGTDRWGYVEGHETYTRQSLPGSADGFVNDLATTRGRLGPSIEPSLDAWIAAFEHRYEFERDVELVGEEEILGIRTVVLEYEPVLDASQWNGEPDEAGVGRIWVDPETLFVLRHVQEIPGWGELLHAEVTEIRYEDPVPAHLLRFEPPAGTTEAQPFTGFDRPEPPGWRLHPVWLPDDYVFASFSLSGPQDWTENEYLRSHEVRHADFIRIRQSISEPELAEAEPGGRWIEAGDREVYVVEQANETRIGWREGDVAITITADTLSLDELLAIAASVE